MGQVAFRRATVFFWIGGLVAAHGVAGCGSAEQSADVKATEVGGGSGAGGSTARGGDGGSGGLVARGGSGAGGFASSSGGRASSGGIGGLGAGGVSTGGMLSVSGGAPSCQAGAPCTCKNLVGTVACTESGPECECPPAEQCEQETEAPCFEPCGGEPFGAWVLEESCFATASGTDGNQDCEKVVQATPGKSDLRMQILDGGELHVLGTEDWSISTRVSLACGGLVSTNACASSFYTSGALLFSTTPATNCEANACGACDCANEVQSDAVVIDSWHREGSDLRLGFVTVPYCAAEDELWIGGVNSGGTPQVSYKFRKQSCTGAPVPCSERTTEQCLEGENCSIGACLATSTGTPARCATAVISTQCSVLQDCLWDPDACTGNAGEACEFASCGRELGCTWGVPNEKCGGQASSCAERPIDQCAGFGCSPRICQPNLSELGSCELISSATECAKAPGCTPHAGATLPCTGEARCSEQTDAAICAALNCVSEPLCRGTQSACSGLSLTDCSKVLGCRREW